MKAVRKSQNIMEVVRDGLCTGCGVCSNTCKNDAVTMQLFWDSYKPEVDPARCLAAKGCSRCLSTCPGKGFEKESYANSLFGGVPEEQGLGRYLSLYAGYSSDDLIRFHSASGGMVTAFLIYLVKNCYIAGAVVTTFCADAPYRTKAVVARTPEEIIAARSSKYCPVSLSGIYDSIVSSEGKYIIVGLPCHIQGFRMLADKDKAFGSKVFGYFGLYCSGTRTSMLPEYLCYKYAVESSKIDSFSFRDGGYPGYLKITSNGQEICRVHYHDYYRKIRAFFNNRRCLLCFDQTAEFSDISFGDIHIPKYLSDNKGINSIIVRSPLFQELLRKAADAGAIVLESVSKGDVVLSQRRMIYMKKERIHAAFLIRELFMKKVPDYGEGFRRKARPEDVMSVFGGLLQTWFGRRRYLWPFIGTMERVITSVSRKRGAIARRRETP